MSIQYVNSDKVYGGGGGGGGTLLTSMFTQLEYNHTDIILILSMYRNAKNIAEGIFSQSSAVYSLSHIYLYKFYNSTIFQNATVQLVKHHS